MTSEHEEFTRRAENPRGKQALTQCFSFQQQKVQISSQSADRDLGRQPSRRASPPDPHPQEADHQRRPQQPQLRQPPGLPREIPGAARGRVRRGQETDPGQRQPRGGAGEAHPG